MDNQMTIQINSVSKKYAVQRRKTLAVKDINLDVSNNDFVSIVGPSGCGKSTLLRMIAGLEESSTGSIKIDGQPIKGPGPDRGLVFQSYSLFPWQTVSKNIEYGLKMKHMPKELRQTIVEKYLRIMDLTQFRDSYTKELSGGMKQRVAIARALANSPKVLLMDEPFGALDPTTKSNMQLMVRELWLSEKPTVVFITHDIEEAVFTSQRIIIMKTHPGEIIDEVHVDLPNERTLDLKEKPAFKEMVNAIKTTMKQSNSSIGEQFTFENQALEG